MKNDKCYLIRDLLPSYIDELTGEETNKEIENHLNECPDCKKAYVFRISLSKVLQSPLWF